MARPEISTPAVNWRRGWDSNPRGAYTPGGFQDRCLQPLGHLSEGGRLANSGGWAGARTGPVGCDVALTSLPHPDWSYVLGGASPPSKMACAPLPNRSSRQPAQPFTTVAEWLLRETHQASPVLWIFHSSSSPPACLSSSPASKPQYFDCQRYKVALQIGCSRLNSLRLASASWSRSPRRAVCARSCSSAIRQHVFGSADFLSHKRSNENQRMPLARAAPVADPS